jgi:hypothetical protein
MAQARRTLVVTAVVIVVIISGITAAVSTPAHTTVSLERKTVGAVYPGNFPDPSILVAKGRYYAYSTQLSGATLDEHEGDTIHDHQFVNVLSPSCPSEVA